MLPIPNQKSIACLHNSFIQDFKLDYPNENGTFLEEMFVVKVRAYVYDADKFFSNGSYNWSICVDITSVKGDREMCNLSVFEENLIRGDPGMTKVRSRLCHSEMGCICESDSIEVSCCRPIISLVESKRLQRQSMVEAFLGWSNKKSQPSKVCELSSHRNKHLKYFIGIKSWALNIAQRNSIRKTWLRDVLSASGEILAYFIIGNTDIPEIQESLKLEQQTYCDTLLGDDLPVTDSYHTLPQKTTLFIHWLLIAKQARPDYVIICDDDVYVNIAALMHYLRTAPPTRLYAGEVQGLKIQSHVFRPQRNPAHMNFVAKNSYPLDEFPYFALGNLIILSLDVVLYIAKNIDMLRPVASLEDVSIGLWMLAIQVHPKHVPGICDITSCDLPSLIAAREVQRGAVGESLELKCIDMIGVVADISVCAHPEISEIRFALTNLVAVYGLINASDFVTVESLLKKSFESVCVCDRNPHHIDTVAKAGATSLWAMTSILSDLAREIRRRPRAKFYLRIVELDVESNQIDEGIGRHDEIWPFESLSVRNQYFLNHQVDDLSTVLSEPVGLPPAVAQSDKQLPAAFYSLQSFAHSNLVGAITHDFGNVLNVAFGSMSTYSIDFIRRLLSLGQLTSEMRSIVFSAKDILISKDIQLAQIDIMVISVSEGFFDWQLDLSQFSPTPHGTHFQWSFAQQEVLQRLVDIMRPRVVIMIAGEAVDLSAMRAPNLNTSLLFIHSIGDANKIPVTSSRLCLIYIPVASFFFSYLTSAAYSPIRLLQPRGEQWARQQLRMKQHAEDVSSNGNNRMRSVAYLYARCDRPERELFFRLLVERLGRNRVHALGVCDGSYPQAPRRTSSDSYIVSRGSDSYMDEAIQLYKHYKFVVAFENSNMSGYMTEKIVAPYLAHAIPIYMGSRDVAKYFSTNSMIRCGDFSSLDDCADFVKRIDGDDEIYINMLKRVPVKDIDSWAALFAWHSDAVNTLQSIELREILRDILVPTKMDHFLVTGRFSPRLLIVSPDRFSWNVIELRSGFDVNVTVDGIESLGKNDFICITYFMSGNVVIDRECHQQNLLHVQATKQGTHEIYVMLIRLTDRSSSAYELLAQNNIVVDFVENVSDDIHNSLNIVDREVSFDSELIAPSNHSVSLRQWSSPIHLSFFFKDFARHSANERLVLFVCSIDPEVATVSVLFGGEIEDANRVRLNESVFADLKACDATIIYSRLLRKEEATSLLSIIERDSSDWRSNDNVAVNYETSIVALESHLFQHTDFIVVLNTLGDSQTNLLLYLSWFNESVVDRIDVSAVARPRIIVDMPNLDLDPTWKGSIDLFLAPSRFVAEAPSTVEHGLPVIIVHPIPHPDFSRTSPCLKSSRVLRWPRRGMDGEFRIIFVGRLSIEKSPGLLLRALAAIVHYSKMDEFTVVTPMGYSSLFLKHFLSSARIRMYGGGPLEQAMRSLAGGLNLTRSLTVFGQPCSQDIYDEEMISFCGPVTNRSLLATIMAEADVLVNPRATGETFGLVHIEAALSGTPVIAFNRGANDESLVTGILIGEVSPISLAHAILKLFSLREKTLSSALNPANMCAKAISVEAQLNPQRHARSFIDKLRSL